MRRSIIYEQLIIELQKINKINTLFKRNDLSSLISKHQKYASFLYKHSDPKNKNKMTIYFKRVTRKGNNILFIVDKSILEKYRKSMAKKSIKK